jgi:hypothetical protein
MGAETRIHKPKGRLTGDEITRVMGGGLLAQAFGALHEGTEQLKKMTGHVGDGHFGWRTAAERYENGWPRGGSVIYCECGEVLVPASAGNEDLEGGSPAGSR